MKQQESHTVKEKVQVKPLPGNVKVTMVASMVKKFEHAKALSASIKDLKK
jgi:hypothetical protein